jgi:hypothetical protein
MSLLFLPEMDIATSVLDVQAGWGSIFTVIMTAGSTLLASGFRYEAKKQLEKQLYVETCSYTIAD